ncbi:hypothetical protein P0Y35_01045 [Kiritimatiellaeota bacterium B1221]|nr:hypothetical protein [Kiritimatiellaeota bacterium B1221]
MNFHLNFSLWVGLLTLGFFTSANADLIIFDGTLKEGGLWSEGSTVTELSSEQMYKGHDVIKIAFGGNWEQGGIWGTDLVVPAETTLLKIAYYAGANTVASGFKVDTSTSGSTFTFGNSTGTWTVDGMAGNTSLLTPESWHTVEMDLTSIPDFVAGTTILNTRIAMQNATGSGRTVYWGEVVMVPEASSLSLLVLALLGVLAFHRR